MNAVLYVCIMYIHCFGLLSVSIYNYIIDITYCIHTCRNIGNVTYIYYIDIFIYVYRM